MDILPFDCLFELPDGLSLGHNSLESESTLNAAMFELHAKHFAIPVVQCALAISFISAKFTFVYLLLVEIEHSSFALFAVGLERADVDLVVVAVEFLAVGSLHFVLLPTSFVVASV